MSEEILLNVVSIEAMRRKWTEFLCWNSKSFKTTWKIFMTIEREVENIFKGGVNLERVSVAWNGIVEEISHSRMLFFSCQVFRFQSVSASGRIVNDNEFANIRQRSIENYIYANDVKMNIIPFWSYRNDSLKKLSTFAESAMSVNRVIVQHFSMNATGPLHRDSVFGLSPPSESLLMQRRQHKWSCTVSHVLRAVNDEKMTLFHPMVVIYQLKCSSIILNPRRIFVCIL